MTRSLANLPAKSGEMLKEPFKSLKGEVIMARPAGAFFIVVEGPDGAGKSTQAELLKTYFEAQGRSVYLTKEPTANLETGKRIRRMLNGEEAMLEPEALQELYTEDRRVHLNEEIIPALNAGKIVICDRYFFSTFAYGMLTMENIEKLTVMNENFLMPDIALTYIASPETCIKRLKEKYIKPDFFEEANKLAKINDAYRKLSVKFPNLLLVDAEKSIEEIRKEGVDLIEKLLK